MTAPAPHTAVVSGWLVETGPTCPDGDRRQRSRQVLVRLTPDEHADLARVAERTGQTMPALLRAALFHLIALEGT